MGHYGLQHLSSNSLLSHNMNGLKDGGQEHMGAKLWENGMELSWQGVGVLTMGEHPAMHCATS